MVKVSSSKQKAARSFFEMAFSHLIYDTPLTI